MSKNYLISEELCDAILTYLSHQPYRDVYQLLPHIQGLTEDRSSEDQRGQSAIDFIDLHKGLWQEFLEYEKTWKPRTDHYDPNWVEEMGA